MLKKRGESSITRKILLSVCAGLFVALTVFILVIEYHSYQFQLDQLHQSQALITEGQSILVSDSLSENEEDSVFLTLSGIIANPIIVGVKLDYYDEGIDDLDIGDINGPLAYSEPISYFDENFNLLELGKLTTYATALHIEASSKKRITHLAGLIAALLLVITAIIALVLRKIVGEPLSLIVSTIENSSIDHSEQIDWASNDEIGLVVQRLNNLHLQQQQRVVGLKQELSDNERREAERLRNLANASFEAILIYTDNQVLDINDRMAKLLDTSDTALSSRPLNVAFKGEFLHALKAPLEGTENFYAQLPLATAEGALIPVELYVSEINYGSSVARVAVMRDITDRIEAQNNIRFMARHDGLTRLYNRTAFMEEFEIALEAAQRTDGCLTVMYLDLDKFKEVNDIFGHAAGDSLLQEVAEQLQICVGSENIVARLGGDEFAIMLTNSCEQKIHPSKLAEKLIAAVDGCRLKQSVGKDFGASIGVAVYDNHNRDARALLAQADLALYQAKATGRNKFEIYREELGDQQRSYRRLVDRLTVAIENDALEMYYQPQANVGTGDIIGFEALLRWNDEELGTVRPDAIVDAAQKERITGALTGWILKTVCKEAATWPSKFSVSVNLTPADLADDKLLPLVKNVLDQYQLSPDRLDLEITESAIISDMAYASKLIDNIKALGVSVSLDDFGTGYSSLSFLQNFTFDRIKLDTSFINTPNEDSQKIARAIIRLGDELGVEVLAEGVETLEQLLRLKRDECKFVQGYFIGRPTPVKDLGQFMDHADTVIRLAG